MGAALLLTLQVAAGAASACTEHELEALAQAESLVARGDDGAAGEALAGDTSPPCEVRRVLWLGLRGWVQARALAPAGGAAELLGPVKGTLDDLQALKRTAVALEAEYAEMAVRAAIAAAQDERPEMELLLTHARDLSERLELRGRPMSVPRPLHVLAGELWFEVDRYDAARAAFEAAIRVRPTPAAYVGLARAHSRLGQHQEACAAYARADGAAPPLRAQAARDLPTCR